jgi:glutaredoxin-dependent peroxiredoxin
MALKIGDSAPDFTLKSKNAPGEKDGLGLSTVKLSDNAGKKATVLLFFPLAFTGVCTQQMCEVSGGLKAFEELGAAVYGISVDSPFSQGEWSAKEKINFPLLSDLNKEASKAYGTLLSDLAGLGSLSARAAFVEKVRAALKSA